MRAFIGVLCISATAAVGDSSTIGLQLPNAGIAYGQDSIRSGEIDCKNSIGGSTQLEFGITGVIDNYNSPFDSMNNSFNQQSRDIGVYARIVIPLDGPKQRINCNSLYQLELKRKRLEVLRLEAELARLNRLNSQSSEFEN